jgi:hypothetical protein
MVTTLAGSICALIPAHAFIIKFSGFTPPLLLSPFAALLLPAFNLKH